jgi:hypothetical protein
VNGVVALIVALTGLLGALAGIIALFRGQRANHVETLAKVDEVHTLVNSQSKEMTRRIDQLTGVLQGAGLEVPGRLNGEDKPSGGPS